MVYISNFAQKNNHRKFVLNSKNNSVTNETFELKVINNLIDNSHYNYNTIVNS